VTSRITTVLAVLIGIYFALQIAGLSSLATTILGEHPAVLDTPEALVLVNSLGPATVKLKVYFWYDLSVHDGFKLTSSLLRLVKSSFERENISMPDAAREVLLPDGVSVHMEEQPQPPDRLPQKEVIGPQDSEELSTSAEGHLASEDVQLRGQARASRTPEEGRICLKNNLPPDKRFPVFNPYNDMVGIDMGVVIRVNKSGPGFFPFNLLP
jgi:small conductance mechanosensitive channel